VLGVVLGLLVAGLVALAAVALRRGPADTAAPGGAVDSSDEPDEPRAGQAGSFEWIDDDLPGFLDQPPGTPAEVGAEAAQDAGDPPLAGQAGAGGDVALAAAGSGFATVRRTVPAHAAADVPDAGRVLLVLATVAVLLIGAASAVAALTSESRRNASAAAASAAPTASAGPTWEMPDLAAVPERPEPGDPGAGELATASVPIGPEGALVRLGFEGVVLERRAVGITAAYPSISATAAAVPGGPALAHVRLPVWNCLTDTAPADPVAAGCQRMPTEYAELPTPALSVTENGQGLRISGRFPTYVRPAGSPPAWTGRAYPITVNVAPDGDSATGTLHLGVERAEAVDDPLLSDVRRGG
jgi:hypothetical protein